MESVYLETTIPSYLAARPSGNLVAAAKQQLTWDWWENYRGQYELFISDVVLVESNRGDENTAKQRLALIADIPKLEITADCLELAQEFYTKSALPESAKDDALHLAVATYHQIDFLLTWNCRHLANAHFLKKMVEIAAANRLKLTHVCTPDELMGVI